MDFEITSDKRNELLSRREVQFTLKYDGATPSRMQIIGKLCALLNIKEHQITLDTLHSSFGKTEITGSARIYDSEESRNKTERPHLAARGMPKPKEEGAHNNGSSQESSSSQGTQERGILQGRRRQGHHCKEILPPLRTRLHDGGPQGPDHLRQVRIY